MKYLQVICFISVWLIVYMISLILVNPVERTYAAPSVQEPTPTIDVPLKTQAAALYEEGMTLFQDGQWKAALSKFETALLFYREAGNRRGEASCLLYIGVVRHHLSDYHRALDAYEDSVLIWQEVEYPAGEGAARHNIARVYRALGRYEEALASYQRVLDIWIEIGDREGEGRTRNNIALIYIYLGRYEEALASYQKILDIWIEIGDQKEEGTTRHNIATLYDDLGRYEKALVAFQQALTISVEIDDRAGESRTRNNIGGVYRALGQYEEALTSYQEALAIRLEIGDRAGESRTRNNIGGVYRALGQYEEALTSYQEALTIWIEISDRAAQGNTLDNIGFVYESQQDISTAILYYQQSIDLTESIQRDIRVEELKGSFASRQISAYTRLINLLWREDQHSRAFEYTERARARAFLDQISNQSVDFRQGAAPELISQEQALRQQIIDLQSALNAERSKLLSQRSQELLDNLSTELEEARSDHEEFIIRLKLASPEYASLVSVDTLSLSEVQHQILNSHTTLIEYFVMDDYTLAWVIDQKSFDVVSLKITRKDLTGQIEYLRNLITNRDFNSEISSNLSANLIDPLKPYIRRPNLIIVPHGVLHYLPFAALWDAESERYLIEDYTITYAPSASVLKFILDEQNRYEGPLLTLGNPDRSLPNAEIEVEAVAQLYNTTPLVGTQATERQVYEQSEQLDILHLAAHGVYDSYNPLFTRIELAGDDTYDGNLEVHEVYGLDLTDANLVVLSACETALGEQSTGDEIVGLTRAFLYAGAPSVVTSLWNVNDESTAYLMKHFYTYLRADMGTAAALRQAQVDTLAEYPAPYHWAAFTLHGDDGLSDDSNVVQVPTADVGEQLRRDAPFLYWMYEMFRQVKLK